MFSMSFARDNEFIDIVIVDENGFIIYDKRTSKKHNSNPLCSIQRELIRLLSDSLVF